MTNYHSDNISLKKKFAATLTSNDKNAYGYMLNKESYLRIAFKRTPVPPAAAPAEPTRVPTRLNHMLPS